MVYKLYLYRTKIKECVLALPFAVRWAQWLNRRVDRQYNQGQMPNYETETGDAHITRS